MNKIILSLGFLSLGLANTQPVYSNEENSNSNKIALWQDISSIKENYQPQQKVALRTLERFRQLSLNEQLFQEQQKALLSGKSRSENVVENLNNINIPLPDGNFVQVSLEETQVLSPDLAAKYPLIKTWKASGVDNKAITGRIDFTHYGFHAMLTMADGDTVFVERNNPKTPGIYKSFSKKSNAESFTQDFQCTLHDHSKSKEVQVASSKRQVLGRAASDLLTYRLAVAATGEYTQYHGGVNNAVSAITTTINRVNQINERDLAVRFELVDTLIYSNPSSDPYTNDDPEVMLEENVLNLGSSLGASTFDIGHLFTQGDTDAGFALLGSVCEDSEEVAVKAGGLTGSSSPIGDAFDIDFVAHELGHQLGATHTFNSTTGSCSGVNRTPQTAFEPGSGSTIMAYAGICGSNNLQANSDAVYHVGSIAQIFSYTRNNGGSECGRLSTVSNNEPEPNAGEDTAIPANTPFVLVGSAIDADSSDILGYSWEQTDVGSASNVGVDTGDNAIIRSRFPTVSPNRYIPRLEDLFGNAIKPGEKLPVADRNLNFALTVRDGEGGFSWDSMAIKVSGTRAFSVTSHQFEENIEIGQSTAVRWNVSGTNSSPINCNSVDIGLLKANGSEQRLKSQTANDGSESVTIPNSALGTSLARFMVKCSGDKSTFFNISTGNIGVVPVGEGSGGTNNGSSGGGTLDKILLLILVFLPLIHRKRLQQKIVNK